MTIDPALTALLRDAAFLYAERDPIGAARALARGIRRQATGAKAAAVSALVRCLAEQDPNVLPAVAADISRLERT